MNCREFETLWDDLLDARWEAPAHLERGLEAHASACPRCRAASGRYQLLRQAISGLRAPAPSPESIDRLYALTVPSGPPTIAIVASSPRHRLRKPLAAAAAFALAWLGGNGWPTREPAWRPGPAPSMTREPAVRPGPALSASPPGGPSRPLGLALAEATEATLDLAREASAPASRIGREMIELGRLSATRPDVARAPAGRPEGPGEPDPAAPGLFQVVGERVGAGVKPISGSARHAFSFLLGPPDGPGTAPVPVGRDSL